MKTPNWPRRIGVSALLLAAGTSRGAQPTGPADSPRPVETRRWYFDPIAHRQIEVSPERDVQAAADDFAPAATPAAPAARPTTLPATHPSPPSVEALIAQLGDDKFAVREGASEALKKRGKEAIPALQRAAASADPQIRISAQALIGQISGTTPTNPGAVDSLEERLRLRRGQLRIENLPGGGARVSRMQVNMVVNGQITRDTTVEENGRKVHIHEDADGIKVEVTDKGKTTETKAKNAAELKANDPAAFKLYENFNGHALGGIRIEPGVRP